MPNLPRFLPPFFVPLLMLALLLSACTSAGEPDSQASPDSTSTTDPTTETSTTVASASTKAVSTLADVGVDVDAKVITIGLLSDLTGPFAVAASDIIAGQATYWDAVNASGGVDGWTVAYVVEDTKYSLEQQAAAYEAIRDDVVAIGLSTGSPHNVATLDAFADDGILVVPLSWYSGWSFPSVDRGLVLELNTNYCLEAMNVLDFVSRMGGQTVALATLEGHYGQDAAAGVKAAVESYGLSLVYDGESALAPGEPITDVIQAIVESGADWTFLATNPSVTADVVGAAVSAGYEGNFTGSYPAYDFRLLDLASGPIISDRFYQSAYYVPWGSEAPGNVEMMNALRDAFPDRRPSDGLIVGWNQAIAMRRVIEAAVANDDLTRRGFVAAANSLTGISFGDTSPDQNYVGEPNEFVQRASAILKPDLATYTSAGGAAQTLSTDGATTGSILVEDFFVGTAAAGYEFNRPCFE